MNEYNSFNLANVTPPVALKWKNNEFILDEYHKFQLFLQDDIWQTHGSHYQWESQDQYVLDLGRSRSRTYHDIYNNFNLTTAQHHDIDYVMQWFEEFCAPICNFWAARFRFSKVYQKQGEMTIDTFYNRILKICKQCEFSDPDERLIDAIIFGMSIVKGTRQVIADAKNSLIYSNV